MTQNLFGAETPTTKPPSSIAYKTVTNFLESFQDSEVPTHIDRSVLPSSMSGGNQAYLVSALKFLGLISNTGVTDEKFHRLVKGNKDERAAVWQEILQKSYSFLFTDLDIERTTTTIVSARFKEQGISGDSIRKAITFFLFAAKDAGLKVSPHIKPQQTRSKSTKTRKTDSKPENEVKETNGGNNGGEVKGGQEIRTDTASTGKALPYQLIDILSDDMSAEEEDAVWTLIRYLKKKKIQGE